MGQSAPDSSRLIARPRAVAAGAVLSQLAQGSAELPPDHPPACCRGARCRSPRRRTGRAPARSLTRTLSRRALSQWRANGHAAGQGRCRRAGRAGGGVSWEDFGIYLGISKLKEPGRRSLLESPGRIRSLQESPAAHRVSRRLSTLSSGVSRSLRQLTECPGDFLRCWARRARAGVSWSLRDNPDVPGVSGRSRVSESLFSCRARRARAGVSWSLRGAFLGPECPGVSGAPRSLPESCRAPRPCPRARADEEKRVQETPDDPGVS